MHKTDPVEVVLARLLPPSLSTGGQAAIEAMLDELAGPAEQDSGAPIMMAAAPASRISKRWRLGKILGGIAAVGIAAAVIFLRIQPSALIVEKSGGAVTPETQKAAQEWVLVGESDRVESMIDEGWREGADGTTMRAMRLNVVEENSLLDRETGIVMQISEPREEIFLMPISSF